MTRVALRGHPVDFTHHGETHEGTRRYYSIGVHMTTRGGHGVPPYNIGFESDISCQVFLVLFCGQGDIVCRHKKAILWDP